MFRSRFYSTNKSPETKAEDNLIQQHDRKHGKDGKWLKYLILALLLGITILLASNYFIKKSFLSNSISTHAKILNLKNNSSNTLQGIAPMNGFIRITYRYTVNDFFYEQSEDVYQNIYSQYFDYNIENVDSVEILYERNNPENSRIKKLNE
ncbi:hypothetical protein LX97_01208 [Nonlabens dokdonensis]|jgi:hypothetical protein|uniref:DUF3592 domain containing protein n=2 Tax=Nonlabens dokdonensis TaxID=328515 RepID=L7W8J8_NONDD|nr:hypothetical protein [Nonlabens dokdonensis]AGC76547.1 hypothetical protein DDD_1420 [Nonlabens dokdonensis DSW-6]PZX44198.1 hypothetical protein LX97_01208 [Nonlabens dokdonensis]